MWTPLVICEKELSTSLLSAKGLDVFSRLIELVYSTSFLNEVTVNGVSFLDNVNIIQAKVHLTKI
jgi:hypothetical protein